MTASERKPLNPTGLFANKSQSTGLGIFKSLKTGESFDLLKASAESKNKEFAWLLRESNQTNKLMVDLLFKDSENAWHKASFSFQLTSKGWENFFTLTGTPVELNAGNAVSQVQNLVDFLNQFNIGEGYSSRLSQLKDHTFSSEDRALPSPAEQSHNPVFKAAKTEPKVEVKPRQFDFHEGPWSPQGIIDPVSHQKIKDPATTMLGATYERKLIEDYLKQHNTDPVSHQTLPTKNLVTNYALKELINDVKIYNDLKDEKAKQQKFKEIEESFNDSILEVMMTKPVLTLTGQTYNEDSITRWFKEHGKDPLTGRVLDEKQRILIPNLALQNVIEEYQAYKTFLEKHEKAATQDVEPATGPGRIKP